MQSEVLARHCAKAGLVEKGVGYWLGRQAVARGSMTEAVAQLRKKGLTPFLAGWTASHVTSWSWIYRLHWRKR